MILKNNNDVLFYRFPQLARFSNIWHGIFTRHNGVSSGSFDSLNVSFNVGDDDANVIQNRNIISRCIGDDTLVFVNQVHGERVLVFAADPSSGDDAAPETKTLPDGCLEYNHEQRLVGDALISDIQGKFLVTQVADCQSVLMYDSVRKVVANVHSGWRGSIQNIIGRTLRIMGRDFGCQPRDILAGIGPSLGPCCAEFVNYRTEIPEKFWKYKDANHHFDFWAVSRDQLNDAGVLPENIEAGQVCTRCDTRNFFSFRGEGRTGRFAAVIGLKST